MYWGGKKLTALLLSATAVSTIAVTPLYATVQYRITKGDNLWTIARKHDTHVVDILKANHIKATDKLRLGTILVIPAPAADKSSSINASTKTPKAAHKAPTVASKRAAKAPAAAVKTAAKAPMTRAKTAPKMAAVKYKIKSGDSLWTIARKHDSHVVDILKANNLTGKEKLQLGKVLLVPTDKPQKSSVACAKPARKVRIAKARVARTTHLAKAKSDAKPRASAKHQKPDTRKIVRVATADVPRSSDGKNQLVRRALSYRGARYRRGGTSASGFDCSGFTRYIYRKAGVSLPHSSRAQAHIGRSVKRNQLKAGDLVFFSTYRRGISHVGIYIGGGKFVHAATYGRGVRTDCLNDGYYRSRYRTARRVR